MPYFLVPLVGWVLEFIKNKSFALAMVTLFVSLVAAYLAALLGVITAISISAPSFVIEAMMVFLPSQFPAQLSVIAAIYSIGICHRVILKSADIFAKSS